MTVAEVNMIKGSDSYATWSEAQKSYVARMHAGLTARVKEFEIVGGKLFISFTGLYPMAIVGKRGALDLV